MLPRPAGLEPAEHQFVIARLRAEAEAEVPVHEVQYVRPVRRRPVLDDDRLHVRPPVAEVVRQPRRRPPLAIVLPRPVLAADRLRRQGEHLLGSGWTIAAPRT